MMGGLNGNVNGRRNKKCPTAVSETANPLRAWRESQRLTQWQVAEMVGVATLQVGLWERGRARPAVANRYRLARLLGVGLRELQERWR